jgi:hypothetical protein
VEATSHPPQLTTLRPNTPQKKDIKILGHVIKQHYMQQCKKKQPVNQELYHYIFEHPFLPSTRFSKAAAAIGCTSCLVRKCAASLRSARMQTASFTLGHSPITLHPLCRQLLCLLLFSSYCCVNNYIHPYELREE